MGPQQLPLTGLAPADVEVWGFNGRPTTGCGYSLPILRDKKTDRFSLYSVTRPGGPGWNSRSEIEAQARLGRVTELPDPLGLPDRPSGEQPVVAWVGAEFLSELEGAGVSFPQTGWDLQSVLTDQPTLFWVRCATGRDTTRLFDEWARSFVRESDERLVAETPAWKELERLADFGLCAARDPATRYQLFTRYCAAIYYSPDGNPERANQVFRLLVRTEFKTLTWERFCADMAVVVGRSREVLRFRAATGVAVERVRETMSVGSARAGGRVVESGQRGAAHEAAVPRGRGGQVSESKVSLADLELSVRATNCLEAEGITSVDELVARTEEELLGVRNFGETCLREVKTKLQEYGLSLRTGDRSSREETRPPVFNKGVSKLEDITPGMEFKGTVQNVVPFGAFVDIGIKESGLVHISQMANRYIKNPSDVVAVGDVVTVWVIRVDQERRMMSLSMIPPGQERRPPERAQLAGGPPPQKTVTARGDENPPPVR